MDLISKDVLDRGIDISIRKKQIAVQSFLMQYKRQRYDVDDDLFSI